MKISIICALIILHLMCISCKEGNDISDDKIDTETELSGLNHYLQQADTLNTENNTTRFFSKEQIDSLTELIDLNITDNSLEAFFYPNMHACGGGVTGYFKWNQLYYIDAQFNAELGFSSRKVYWENGSIIKILYHTHFAHWDEFFEEHGDIDPVEHEELMKYTDNYYEIYFTEEYLFKQYDKDGHITSKADQELIEKLVECAHSMKISLVQAFK